MRLGPLSAAAAVPVLLGISGNFTEGTSTSHTKGHKAAVACHFSLNACPEIGCTEEDSPDALTNLLKKRIPTATKAKAISIDDLIALQNAAEQKVGTKKASMTLAQRKKLQNLSAGGHKFSEGDLVVATGFIAGDPHPNKRETVNCNLGKEANNDIHINIVEEANDDETQGFVVEMIPQDRKPEWTDVAVSKIAKEGKQVLVYGQLFYDSKHQVNADADDILAGEPKRLSLFEIHPVTRFLVCKTGSGCDAKKEAQWIALEDMH